MAREDGTVATGLEHKSHSDSGEDEQRRDDAWYGMFPQLKV